MFCACGLYERFNGFIKYKEIECSLIVYDIEVAYRMYNWALTQPCCPCFRIVFCRCFVLCHG